MTAEEMMEPVEDGCEHQTPAQVKERWNILMTGAWSEVSICVCCTGPARPLLRAADGEGSVTFGDGTFMTGLPPGTKISEAHNCTKCKGGDQ